jgi:hypothetical protein
LLQGGKHVVPERSHFSERQRETLARLHNENLI